jgi:hypothetical protein
MLFETGSVENETGDANAENETGEEEEEGRGRRRRLAGDATLH